MSKNIINFSENDISDYDNKQDNIPNIKIKKTYKKKNILINNESIKLNFIKKLEEIEFNLNIQYENIKKLNQDLKELKNYYNQDIIKIQKLSKYNNTNTVGFKKKIVIPDVLCKLVNINLKSELTVPEFTRLIYNELKKRNLQYDKDKRIYRIDNEFKNIFDLSFDVNNSITYPDKNGFNIGTMQYYIFKVIKKYKD
jgi:hypothetical protein